MLAPYVVVFVVVASCVILWYFFAVSFRLFMFYICLFACVCVCAARLLVCKHCQHVAKSHATTGATACFRVISLLLGGLPVILCIVQTDVQLRYAEWPYFELKVTLFTQFARVAPFWRSLFVLLCCSFCFCITVAFKVCATELYSCLPQFSLRHVAGGAQHTFGLKRAFLLEKGQLAGLLRILMLV